MVHTLVIFDIDGTLLHSNRVDSECFAEAYAACFGREFPTIDWHQYPHVTDTTIFDTVIRQHFNRPANPDDIQRQQDYFVQLLQDRRAAAPHDFREVPAARRTVLDLLNHPGYQVGIATGGWRRPAMLKLRHVDIPTEAMFMNFADGCITREAIIEGVFAQYPDPLPPRIVYVGDALWDVKTTRRMQLNFVGIRLRGDVETLQTAGASHVLQDYRDFAAFERALAEATPPR